MLIDMIAALLASLLSGLGVGSGGLLVIYLTLWGEMEQRLAQGINLLFFLASGGAALVHHVARRHLYWRIIFWLTLFGIGGTLLGSALSAALPSALLRRIFGGGVLETARLSQNRRDGDERA